MAIKKFSQFVAEASATDLTVQKDGDQEVKGLQPRSKGEVDFVNAHMVTKNDYYAVPGQDHIFNGDVKEVKEEVENDDDDDDDDDEKEVSKKKKDDDDDDDDEDDDDEDLEEGNVMDSLAKIVKDKQNAKVKFANGKTLRIDMTTANAMLNMHKKLNDKNKAKMDTEIEKSPEVFMKLMDVAFGGK